MVRRGGYRTQAQKEGRSAGQRQRRMARDRKRQNREMNIYPISVRAGTLDKSRHDAEDLAMYGIYRDDTQWILTALTVRRDEEKLVSDRQGATRSEVVDRLVVVPSHTEPLDPKHGLRLGTFDSKKDAMNSVSADSSTRIDTGEYVVRPDDTRRNMNTFKVDRDDYREFKRSHNVRHIRD